MPVDERRRVGKPAPSLYCSHPDVRLVDAVSYLIEQFRECGLTAPIAIQVRPSDLAVLRHQLEGSLFRTDADRAVTTGLRVYGVEFVATAGLEPKR